MKMQHEMQICASEIPFKLEQISREEDRCTNGSEFPGKSCVMCQKPVGFECWACSMPAFQVALLGSKLPQPSCCFYKWEGSSADMNFPLVSSSHKGYFGSRRWHFSLVFLVWKGHTMAWEFWEDQSFHYGVVQALDSDGVSQYRCSCYYFPNSLAFFKRKIWN